MSARFGCGFNTKGNNSTNGRTLIPVYLGSMRGSGSISRKYKYCENTDNAYFCLFDPTCNKYLPPPKPLPTYTFYYNRSDVTNLKLPVNYDTGKINNLSYNKCQTSNLFNKNHTNILGDIFYDITISNFSETDAINVQKAYLNIYGTYDSVLTFTISLLNSSEAGYIDSGVYKFQITGGTGQFLNSKGYVIFTIQNFETKLEIYLE